MSICKCGQELEKNSSLCPSCGYKLRKRKINTTRMLLAITLFVLGLFAGIFLDRVLFFPKKQEKPTEKVENKLKDKEKAKEEVKEAHTDNMMVLFSSKEEDRKPIDIQEPQSEPELELEVEPIKDQLLQIQDEKQMPSIEPLKTNEITEIAKSTSSKDPIENTESQLKDTQKTTTTPEVESDSANASKHKIIEEEPLTKELIASEKEDIHAPKLENKLDHKLVIKNLKAIEVKNKNNYHGTITSKGCVFVSDREKVNGRPTYQCYLKENGQNNAKKLFSWQGNVWTPELTPKEDKVVFSSNISAPEHIFLFDLNNNKSVPLTSGKSKNMMPTISPKGDKIAYVSNEKGRNSIWVMGINGDNKEMLTTGSYDDREPRWADNGNALIFTRIYQGLKKSHILKVALSDKNITPIIETDKRNWLGDLSTNGRFLLYTKSKGKTGSMNSIILKDLHLGTEEKLDLQGGTEHLRPIWAKDSMSFVFHKISRAGRTLHQAFFKWEKL